MHAMLVGYARAHAPRVATLIDAQLIRQQDSDGSALRHALASLLLDELHPRGDDGSLARSILYDHKYASESRFERRAAAVAVLTTDAYKEHPTLLEKNRPKLLEGARRRSSSSCACSRLNASDCSSTFTHAARRRQPPQLLRS